MRFASNWQNLFLVVLACALSGCLSSVPRIPNASMQSHPGSLRHEYEQEYPGDKDEEVNRLCRNEDEKSGVEEIGFETTSCYGLCPEYTATLFADGSATYEGRANVERVGYFRGHLEPARFELLARLILEARLFEGPHRVSCGVTDNSAVYFSIVRGGKRSTLYHYAQYYSGTATLNVIEEVLESDINSIQWQPAGR